MTYIPGGAGGGASKLKIRNNTGSDLLKGTPISINSLGEMSLVDVSDEDLSFATVGVLSADCLDGAIGDLNLTGGIVENITTSFSLGDAIFISKTGSLTNIKPNVGVNFFEEGDFIIYVGNVAINSKNNSHKDLVLNIRLVGQF